MPILWFGKSISWHTPSENKCTNIHRNLSHNNQKLKRTQTSMKSRIDKWILECSYQILCSIKKSEPLIHQQHKWISKIFYWVKEARNKSVQCVKLIYKSSKTGKTNLCDRSQNSGYLGVGKWLLLIAMKEVTEFSVVMEIFYTFFWMVLTHMYWSMKIHWTTHFVL